MSSSRSKSKDKKAVGKEPLKASTKLTSANIGGTAPASGYNPLLGTFHSLETPPVSSLPPVHANGRFRDIDDTDDPSVGIGMEYDCVSNNGSWSGESEDPKDKPSQGLTSRQEAGLAVDSDKREKIRQKNEKKHQRQKERRAQELHERCRGYLMSRKLDALAQQLVAMGFSSERATMALMLNEGKLEESVAWLFEGGEEDSANQNEHKSDQGGGGGGGNLKVDISQELAQIADMEIKFKCSKQEVERAVVACEGDLEKAAENLLKFQKQESNAALLKPEETGVPPKPPVGITQMPPASQVQQSKQNPSLGAMNFPTMAVAAGRSVTEPGVKNIQLLKKVPPAPSLEKRWAVGGLSPSSSFSLASSLQAAPPLSKTEIQYAGVGNEFKYLQIGSVREPVIMMQRPQSKQIPATSMSSSSNSMVEPVTSMSPNGFHTTRSFNGNTQSHRTNQLYDQFQYQPRHASSGGLMDHHGGQPPVATNHMNNNNGLWSNRTVGSASSPPLAAATSLGLFSGFGSNGISNPSQVDWNGDWSSQFDYTNIDWSLNRLPSPAGNSFIPNGLWIGSGSSPGRSAGRPASSIGGGVGLHHPDGGAVGVGGGSEVASGGSREWTSPFEEKDLFSLPRQFVSSPSL